MRSKPRSTSLFTFIGPTGLSQFPKSGSVPPKGWRHEQVEACILSPVVALAAFTFTASVVTLCGLGTIRQAGIPTAEWWGYLFATMPDAYTQAWVNEWLFYGAAAGLIVAALAVFRIPGDDGVRLSVVTVAPCSVREIRYAEAR